MDKEGPVSMYSTALKNPVICDMKAQKAAQKIKQAKTDKRSWPHLHEGYSKMKLTEAEDNIVVTIALDGGETVMTLVKDTTISFDMRKKFKIRVEHCRDCSYEQCVTN